MNFGNAPERLKIPYDALETFVDPSVEFGLRFESQDEEEDEADEIALVEEAPMAEDVVEDVKKEAEIVSLDKFRK